MFILIPYDKKTKIKSLIYVFVTPRFHRSPMVSE
nr:MAG TPA: hypothetical protein [Bacteriophage sp.]